MEAFVIGPAVVGGALMILVTLLDRGLKPHLDQTQHLPINDLTSRAL